MAAGNDVASGEDRRRLPTRVQKKPPFLIVSARDEVLRAFHRLPTREQLEVYEEIRDFLDLPHRVTQSGKLADEKRDSLRAIGSVAGMLSLAPGVTPSAARFNALARKAAPGWNTSRVSRAWGSWRFACEAFAGATPRLSPLQEARRSATVHARRTTGDYVAGVREWLLTKPAGERKGDYDAFVAIRNESDRPPFVTATTLTRTLGLSWDDLKRVARDELSLADASGRVHATRELSNRSSYDLVALAQVVGMVGGHEIRAKELMAAPGAPAAVYVDESRALRLWYRSDVSAYLAQQPFPKRVRNELGSVLLNTRQVAALLELSPRSVTSYITMKQRKHLLPGPAVAAGGIHLWLRPEVEDWLKANPNARRKSRKAATSTGREGGSERRSALRRLGSWT